MDVDKVLVIEDDRGLSKKIVNGLSHLLSEMDMAVDILVAHTYQEGLMLAQAHDIKAFVVDINLPDDQSGVELVKEIRKLGYTYNGVIFVTDKSGAAYQVQVHEETKYTRFLTKPVNLHELAGEVAIALRAPSEARDEYLPPIKSNVSFKLLRSTTLLIQKVKHKDIIIVWQRGANFDQPIRKEYPIDTFERLVEQLLLKGEKQFMQCERTTIVNTDAIEEINKAKHHIKLTGYPEKISVGPAFRTTIYTLF